MLKRPDHFIEAIDNAYNNVKRMKQGYVWTGNERYLFEHGSDQINTHQVLEKTTFKPPITVLDIGTAGGQFILKNDSSLEGKYKHFISVYGISATDDRDKNSTIPDEKYIEGNAENLAELKKITPLTFDYIFSSKTFIHLIDPIGTLIRSYDKLKPGGILMVDGFTIKGCEGRIQDIINQLRQDGHCLSVSIDNQSGTVKQLIIKKTERPLFFPVEYHDTKTSYKPAPSLRKDNRTNIEKLKSAHRLLSDKLNHLGLTLLKDEYNSLDTLLKSVFFKTLTLEQQETLISYIVTKEITEESSNTSQTGFFPKKSVSLSDIFKLREYCQNRAVEGMQALRGNLRAMGTGNYLLESTDLSIEEKLNLIRLTVCQNILSMDMENVSKNEESFQQMHIPTNDSVNNVINANINLFIKLIEQLHNPPLVVQKFFTLDNYQNLLNSKEINAIISYLDRNPNDFSKWDILRRNNCDKVTSIKPSPDKKHFSLTLQDDYTSDFYTYTMSATQFINLANTAFSWNKEKENRHQAQHATQKKK